MTNQPPESFDADEADLLEQQAAVGEELPGIDAQQVSHDQANEADALEQGVEVVDDEDEHRQ
jgi:hypothetical protein